MAVVLTLVPTKQIINIHKRNNTKNTVQTIQNTVETFLLPTDAHNVKKHRVIKTFLNYAPTCFGLRRNHLQGATVIAWLKITHLVNSICIKDVQGVVSAMAAYCDL